MSKMKKLFDKIKHFALSFLIRLLGLLLQFGLGIAVARFLGASGSGIYSIYTSWFNLLSNVIAFGLPQLCTRKVSVLFSQGDVPHIRQFIAFSFKIFALISTPIVFVFYFLNPYIATALAGGEEQGYVLKLAAIAATAFIFLKFLSEILRSINKLNTAMLIESFSLPLMLIVGVYGIYVAPVEDKATYFLITHVFLLVFLSWVSWFLCAHHLKHHAKPASHPDSPIFTPPATRTLVTFWVSSTLGMWFLNMPLLVAPVFADLHDTGVFSAAYRLITVIVNVMMVLAGMYGPRFARNFNDRHFDALQKDLKKTAYISFAMFVPLFAVFIAVPEMILGIFGADFEAGADWLRVMAVGQLIYSGTGLVGLLMNMMHQEKLEMILMLVSACVMLFLMLLLGHFYAMMGIAIGFACGLAFKNLLSLFFVRKILKNLVSENS
jgi:O-antigen/teichoic acid export membrane protein